MLGPWSARSRPLSKDAAEVAIAGRDASLEKAERVAQREGNAEARASARDRRNTGALEANELPIKKYENLSTQDAIAAVMKP